MDVNKNFLKKFYKKEYLKILPDLKQEKTRQITTLCLTFFALSFFGLFAINPTLSTIAELQKKVSDNMIVDKKLEEKITNLGILQQKYNLLGKDLSLALSAIPTNPNAPYLIGQIQSLADSSNVTIKKIQTYQVEVSKFKEKKDFSSFTFSVEGEANSYKDISNFLSLVTFFDRIISIDMVSINTNEKNIFRVSFRGKAYFKE